MSSSRRRLERTLYALAAVTALLIGLTVGYRAWRIAQRADRVRAMEREETRTHPRALASTNLLEGDAARAYALLSQPVGGARLGLISMPSFGPWYVVELRAPTVGEVAQGEMISIDRNDRTGALTVFDPQSFTLSKADYRRIDRQVGDLTNQWPGVSGGMACMDGVVVAFQRAQAGGATSGVGNASCDRHYAALGVLMAEALARFHLQAPMRTVDH